MTAVKQLWVCPHCRISQLAAKRPKCPGCGTGMVRATLPGDDKTRIAEMLAGFARIKSLTKQHPASQWDDAYRTLANEIHAVGRDCFYIEPETE